jgi:hypothetical protein
MRIYALRSKEKDAPAKKVTLCILQGQTIPYFSPGTEVTAKLLAVLGLWKIPSVDYSVHFNNCCQWTSMYTKRTSGKNEVMDNKSKLSESWGAMNDKYRISCLLISYGKQALNIQTQMVTFISWFLQLSASSSNYSSTVYHHYSLTT